MSEQPQRMSISEFREKGYLKELNRRFLHPLGLALELSVDDYGEAYISGVWDYRDDPEGILFDLKNSSQERIESFKGAKEFIDNEIEKRKEARVQEIGDVVEPIPKKGVYKID